MVRSRKTEDGRKIDLGYLLPTPDFGLRTSGFKPLVPITSNYFPPLHISHIEKIVFLIKTESHGF